MIEEPALIRCVKKEKRKRPTLDQLNGFSGVPTAYVADAMFGVGCMSSEIKPLSAGKVSPVLVGPALTVNSGPGDILALLVSLSEISTGDVIVNAFGGCRNIAAAGDRVLSMMDNVGAAGFITDGPVRDSVGILKTKILCFSAGLSPNSPSCCGPGTIGFPVDIGGKTVVSGDIIVADAEGVVVVPLEQVDNVLKQLQVVKSLEASLDKEIEKGLKIPKDIAEFINSDQIEYL